MKHSDIAHEKAMDDLYTLTVNVTDMAGNESEKKIQYSINRFGSVYVLSDGTKAIVDNYYTTVSQDIVITEINVDTLDYKDVSVACDGSVKTITEGNGYTASDITNNNSWHSITYTVSKSNFNRDGIYTVTVYSEDKATNKQSNQSKDAEIKFLLDTTAPSVIVSGLEDSGVYQEDSHDFTVNASDTIGVDSLTVFVDDDEFAAYTSDELNETGGTKQLTLESKDEYQNIKIVCTDVAGNESVLAYNNILISKEAKELLNSGDLTPTKGNGEEENASIFTMKTVMPVAAGIVVAFGAGAGMLFFGKKKKM